ncbi:MAG: glycine cleavage system protein GcvH [Kiritimatiellae bacterium]|nr:glycine cleavage system protein GcvH [Kiritimatiellia bacterium]
MSTPDTLKYTKDHEWVRLDGDTAVIGITDHAQSELGDITYVELPAEGKKVCSGEEIAVIESVKAASDILAPIAGTVSELNSTLDDEPEAINDSPYENGWICKLTDIDTAAVDALMSAADYEAFIAG